MKTLTELRAAPGLWRTLICAVVLAGIWIAAFLLSVPGLLAYAHMVVLAELGVAP